VTNSVGEKNLIPTSEERSRIPVAFLAGIVIVLLLVAGAVLLSKYSAPAGPVVEKPLPMGAAEQAYAPQLHFLEPKMSRAANFLNQEVTFVFGTLENAGNRKVKQVEVTLEFHDPFGQVVQREKERLFGPNADPLPPGQQRDFQLGYEHISAQWNNVYPSVRVTGLDLN
jgi:hypothetical protein